MAPRHLFMKMDIFSVQQHQQQEAKKAVWQVQPDRLTADEEELVTQIANDFVMDLPLLNESEIYQTDRQVQIDARRLPNRMTFGGRPVPVNGTEITIHIPFSGDPALFDVRPSTHTLNPPFGDIDPGRKEILLTYRTADATAQIKAEYERTLQEIKQHLEWLRPAATETAGLKQVVRSELARRRQTDQAHANIVGSLGLPRRNVR